MCRILGLIGRTTGASDFERLGIKPTSFKYSKVELLVKDVAAVDFIKKCL